jgi:TldD protein
MVSKGEERSLAELVDEALASRVLRKALATGGEFAELFVEDHRSVVVGLDDGRIEQMSSGHERGAGIRVVTGVTTGFAHTADLSERGLLAAAEAASAVARSGGRGRKVALSPRYVDKRGEIEVLPSGVAKQAKVELLQRADAAARSAGPAIRQVGATYREGRRQVLVANSEGALSTDDTVRVRLGVSVTASGDGGLQTGGESVGATAGFELFDRHDVEEMARSAAGRALRKLKARPAPTGTMPVVIRCGSGGVLFHEACGHGLEADHVAKDVSVFAGKVGEQVASPLVTLVDDGALVGQWGATSIDDEGHPSGRNVLIQDGILTAYMWDWLRATKSAKLKGLAGAGREGLSEAGLGWPSNGRRQSYQHLPMVRMTNTFVLAGTEDPEEIVRQTPRGLYVAQLGGGQVNTATGDFVFGITEAYMIEKGELTEPVRDANLIGNGLKVLQDIDAVANDFAMGWPGTCGKQGQSVPVGTGQPTLRVRALTVGGTAGEARLQGALSWGGEAR